MVQQVMRQLSPRTGRWEKQHRTLADITGQTLVEKITRKKLHRNTYTISSILRSYFPKICIMINNDP